MSVRDRENRSKGFWFGLFKHVGLAACLLYLFIPLHFLASLTPCDRCPFSVEFTLHLAFACCLSIYNCQKDGISPFSRLQDIWKLAAIVFCWGNRRCFWQSSSTPTLLFQYNILSAACRLQTRLGKPICREKAKPQYQMRKRPWQYIFQDEFGWSGVAYDFIVVISTSCSPIKYDVQYCSCSRDGKTISWFISVLKKNDSALEFQTRTSLFLVLQWVCSCSSNNTYFPVLPLHKE